MPSSGLQRVLSVLLVSLLAFGAAGSAGPAFAADDPSKHAEYGPPEDPPKEWMDGGLTPGVDKDGNWCILYEAEGCDHVGGGELPGTVAPCSDGTDCTAAERREYELKELKKWRDETDQEAGNYEDLNAFITTCLNDGDLPTFRECYNTGLKEYPPPRPGLGDWVAGEISELASDALREAAGYIGASVVWLLEEFAKDFNEVSTIDLGQAGIGQVLGIMSVLSVLVATFLLLAQWGKVAISQQGGPIVTVITGLAKWAVITAVYVLATQTALSWSDALSTWIVNESFDGGGSGGKDATEAMQKQLGTLFSALVATGGGAAAGGALVTGGGVLANAVGVVIVVGVLCILAIGALWVEMFLRQAGVMILIVVMPIVLAGQLMDGTREWWPKARNALIALVLMKPVIVTCFAIGFGAMTQGEGIRNVIAGLIIFLLASFAWPVLAKFMTFTSTGDGSGTASGMLGTVGSSVSSMFGGYQPSPSGAGSVGGGRGYTQALEEDTATTAGSGSNARNTGFWSKALKGSGSGSFGSKVAGGVGLGLQAAAAGKGVLEGAATNTAAHAGLGQPGQVGGNVVVPQRQPHAPASRPAAEGGTTPGSQGTPAPAAAQPPAAPQTEPPPAAAPVSPAPSRTPGPEPRSPQPLPPPSEGS